MKTWTIVCLTMLCACETAGSGGESLPFPSANWECLFKGGWATVACEPFDWGNIRMDEVYVAAGDEKLLCTQKGEGAGFYDCVGYQGPLEEPYGPLCADGECCTGETCFPALLEIVRGDVVEASP